MSEWPDKIQQQGYHPSQRTNKHQPHLDEHPQPDSTTPRRILQRKHISAYRLGTIRSPLEGDSPAWGSSCSIKTRTSCITSACITSILGMCTITDNSCPSLNTPVVWNRAGHHKLSFSILAMKLQTVSREASIVIWYSPIDIIYECLPLCL